MLKSYQYSGSYDDLLKLMIQHAQHDEIPDQIVQILKQFFESELGKENRRFSRPERNRVLQELSKAIFADALGKIDGTKS